MAKVEASILLLSKHLTFYGKHIFLNMINMKTTLYKETGIVQFSIEKLPIYFCQVE